MNRTLTAFALMLLVAAAFFSLAPKMNTSARCSPQGTCEVGDSDTDALQITTDGGNWTFDGTFIGDATGTIGWTVNAGANTACTTTCVTPCVFGVNTASATADIVDCADATADECLCAGGS